ncbi:MAG TPA: DNA-formamidopyrimidine glycosylase family protein, partial [Nitrososphaeraceae archaeon]|nr:DNA-formamidopyrimidine glycosylase family protein [Nitrososphaeraceae archaeon]
MSEGPEVKFIADMVSSTLQGKKIEDIICNKLNGKMKKKIVHSKIEYVKAYGKNLVFKFSSGIFLRNHMMMWGKWRIYDRSQYNKGLSKPPPRRSNRKQLNSSRTINNEKDVRSDSRVRLTILTNDSVLIEFNGPILQFSIDDPAKREPIRSLGPDCLNHQNFDVQQVKKRLLVYSKKKELLISDALLNQKIIAGIGNKYKSEILFVCKINPFQKVSKLDLDQQYSLFEEIPKLLKYGYQ